MKYILAIALVAVAVTVTDAVKGNLTVNIKRAVLPGKNVWVFKPDPYVNVTAIGKMEKITRLTKIIHNSYKPVWNQVLDFCYGDWIKMEISVHDHDHITSDDVLIPVFTRTFVVKFARWPVELKNLPDLIYYGPKGTGVLFYGSRID